MRCDKCGYISFDYLSECKKCRTSLTSAREGFGFFYGRPAVPSLLGSLLSDYTVPAHHENAAPEIETSSSFDLGTEVGDESRHETAGNELELSSPAIAGPNGSEEDFSLLDISDEELDLLIDEEDPPVSGKVEATAPESLTGGMDTGSVEEVSAAGSAPASPEILPAAEEKPPAVDQAPDEPVLNFDQYPQDVELGAVPAIDSISELIDNPTAFEEAPTTLSGQPSEQIEAPTDGFVIELSENDLETLLEELDATPKGAA